MKNPDLLNAHYISEFANARGGIEGRVQEYNAYFRKNQDFAECPLGSWHCTWHVLGVLFCLRENSEI